jgi:hypothetical protein
MGKVQRIPLGRKPEQRRIDLADEVSVQLTELAHTVKGGLLSFAVAVGLQVFDTLLQQDVTSAAGLKGRHDPDWAAYRHSTEPTGVPFGGRKVKVDKPRVRTVDGTELRLPSAGMEVAAGQFRRVRGYRDIPMLAAALRAHAERVSEGGDTVTEAA